MRFLCVLVPPFVDDFAENGHKNTELTALFAVPRGVKALPWQFECLRCVPIDPPLSLNFLLTLGNAGYSFC